MLKRLRELRLQKRLSREGLARASGLSAKTIQRLEDGPYHATELTFLKLADALEVDVKELDRVIETRICEACGSEVPVD